MKISLPAFVLLTNLLFAAAACAAPEVSVEQGSFNFGTIPQGKKVQHNFAIKNSGDAPLQIKQLTASCGCTAAKPSATSILPGRSAEIQVTFDSTNFSGKVQKTVTMMTNAGKTPNYTFSLDGNIVEELQVAPRQLSLGPIETGAAKQATITVTNRGTGSVKLLSVNVTSNSLQIKATIKKGEIKPGETGIVELAITPRPEAKVLSGYVHIVTSSQQKKEITVPVYASLPKAK
jgi:hypothetical protein